ncbi:Peptidase family M23 [Clostridium collagenovorans DSM 3089]|uniref:Peptidase family M23 n=1 Tax=Clostridium collagenovorans DSM 3089 TaxID=1121306 RepID=A0A1M5XTH6_9CLOT|nr:M23 family metallopeptidase [Clostridium collagenovorans]SHI02553.1 Peptidase family M23 [Clostridium collagenovorans DSM 3089]
MSNYRMQYENYYNNISKKRKVKAANKSNDKEKITSNYRERECNHRDKEYDYILKRNGYRNSSRSSKKSWANTIIMQLSGVLIMSVLLLGCKAIDTSTTQKVYSKSCTILSKNYDLTAIASSIKNGGYKEFEGKVLSYIDGVKSKVLGGKTLEERLKEDFSFPTIQNNSLGLKADSNEGKVISTSNKGVASNRFVQAASSGKVVKCDFRGDKQVVLIDHGQGIQTEYAGLDEVFVCEGDYINRDENIGAVKEKDSEDKSCDFKLLYMGKDKDFQKYIN